MLIMSTQYIHHEYTVNYLFDDNQPWSINSNNSGSLLDGDEELLVLDNSRLDFCDNNIDREEDFCRCLNCSHNNISMISSGNIDVNSDTRNDHDSHHTHHNQLNGHLEPSRPPDRHHTQHNHHLWSNHCHPNSTLSNNRRSESVKKAKRQLIIGCVLCLMFMIVELVGGFLSNSLAIMTDAAHLLSDLVSFGLSLLALWISQKAPTKRMSFGYYRAEVLGAVASVFMIWILTGILVYLAIDRIRYDRYEIDTKAMLIVSGSGVAFNLIMGITLSGNLFANKANNAHNEEVGHRHDRRHGHGQSHGHSHVNMNVRAALIHVIGDLIQSVGVLVAAFVIHYKPEAKIADPICTFVFSGLVIVTTFNIMKSAVLVLMEAFPTHLEYTAIKDALQSLNGVKTAHSLHIWSLTLDRSALSVHLAIDSRSDAEMILKSAENLIRKEYDIQQTTIQVEKYDERTMNECHTCKGPAF